MDYRAAIAEALLTYLLFIPLLTFHEWAHAWTAWKCGDDTAYKLGRVSLNPIVHMELIGTVVLPLLGIVSGALGAGFVMIGWGRPVPVSLDNLKYPRAQDTLIAMAGPLMNLLLAFVLLVGVKIAIAANQNEFAEVISRTAKLSLFLCFFNLLPIPPLDGSHLLLNATRMSYELYYRLIPIGFILVLVLMNMRPVQNFLVNIVVKTFVLMARPLGLPGLDKF